MILILTCIPAGLTSDSYHHKKSELSKWCFDSRNVCVRTYIYIYMFLHIMLYRIITELRTLAHFFSEGESGPAFALNLKLKPLLQETI